MLPHRGKELTSYPSCHDAAGQQRLVLDEAGQLHSGTFDLALSERLLEKSRQAVLGAISCPDARSKKKEWCDNDDVHLRQQGLSWVEVDGLRRSHELGKGRGPRRQELEWQEEVLQAARAIVGGASACVHGNDHGDVSAQSSPRLFR